MEYIQEIQRLDSQLDRVGKSKFQLLKEKHNLLTAQRALLNLNDIPALQLRVSGKRFDTRVKVQPKIKIQKSKVMKSKITLPSNQEKIARAMVAARFAGCEAGELKKVNPDTVSLVLTHSTPNQLVDLGRYYATISDADIKEAQAEIAAEKKAAEEKAKAAKK